MRLSLRRKAALGLLALALLSIGALVTVDRLVLPQRFDRVERLEVERDALRVVNALEVRGELLDVLLVDWAQWDDTYEFMEGSSEEADEYRASNLVEDLLDALGLGALIFVDTDGEIRESLWRWPSGEGTPIAGLESDSEAVHALSDEAQASGTSVGVVRLPVGHPMLAAARPITRSDGNGTSRGTLIMALWLDDDFAAELSESLATPLRFETLTSEPHVVDLTSRADAVAIVEDGELNGQALVRDIEGQPAFLVETNQRREIASLRDQALWLGIAAVVLTIGMAALMIYIATEVLLLRPMLRMRHELALLDAGAAGGSRQATAGAGGNPIEGTSRLSVRGRDEIAEVARAVNAMLDRLADSTAEQERLTIAVDEQEEVARTALLEMGEGFLAFDHGGRCQVCNPAAARMLKRSPELVRGRHISELLPAARAPQYADGPQIIEVAGRALAITRSSNLQRARSGRSVVVLRDVTDILDVERLKRDIIATVSHELRTPLTSIRATVELFQEGEGGALSEVQARMLTLLSRNTDRLLHIVNDLLALTTLESGTVALRREECDLSMVALRVVEDLQPLAAAAAIDLDVDATEAAVAWGDEPRIRQVIENLVQNAIKFSPSGSRIAIGTHVQRDEVVVSVRDEGPGITGAEQERVFEKFYRSPGSERVPGTGLGLPIARLIVELHGGRIWIESDGAMGTTVRFTVPAPP